MKTLLSFLVLACLTTLAGVCLGSGFLPPQEWLSADGPNLIAELRFARMAAAFIVGGSLALSGAILQAVLRNPLADPYILGVSGGSAIGAVLAFTTGLYALSAHATPLCALLGGAGILALVLAVSAGGRGPERILLTGVIMGTVCSGVLTFLISQARSDELAGIFWWLLGDLQCANPSALLLSACLLLVSTLLTQRFAGALNAFSFGTERAWNLGENPRLAVPLFAALASLLAATSVSVAGIIGFCGLVVPHAVRRLAGSNHRRTVLLHVVAGGIFLQVCDTASRVAVPNVEIPIGVATALIGGPAFLWILNRGRSHHGF